MIAILDNQDHLLCLLDDYTESNLHTFLQGTAAFFKCSVVQNSEYSQYFKVGNKVSFVWNDISYHFDITATTKNEELVSIQADSLTLELRNEDSRAYKASKAMTFKEYLDVFLFAGDNPIVLGINEVADKKLQLEWEGSEDSVLARLFSLANKFGAEIEFETVLNRHWGLDKIKLNVYREHDDKHQGIGKRRTDILLEYGHNIETIEIEENIDNLKTAIHATGKDGLTPASVLIDEKDADGNRLYYSPIGDGSIRAVQARNQFMSKVNGEGYIAKNWTYETDNPNVLAAQALAELKKISKVEVTVKIKGYEYLGIGDTILAQDTGYNPVLNLEARISEQDIYFDNPENNTSTFTNVEILKSEVDESLINRVKELVESNKTYDVQILTTNGYSFKNGFGETTLTARVMDGARDATNEFSLTWFKNGTEYSHDASIIVRAGSIDELATYLIIAEKDGRERGRNELTVFNVKDGSPGKTPVVHLAWADSADGTVKFTTELPTDWIPKYRGYYVDYSSVASTNPKLYKWERNPDDAAKVADEAKDKADAADSKADSAIDTANSAKDTADEASKQTALVNGLANAAKELADKAKADAAEANRLLGLTNTEISKLNTNVNNVRSDLASAETDLNSKIETVKTTLTQNYATKTNLSETQLTLNKTITDSVASVKQEMSEKYAVKSDLTTLQGEYNSFKEETAKKISQQVSSIETIQTNTTEAQKLAGEAYNKAQSAAASATNASSTANSALDKASNATNVANSASQNATNAVASANSAVSTANTAKSNADKAIADVAALTKTVSSQSTKIDQTSSRIDQVASGITEVGNKLDNLQVGGRNLVVRTGEKFVMGYGIPNTTWENGRAILKYGSGNNPMTKTEILPQNGAFDEFVMKRGVAYTQSLIVETDATFAPTGKFDFSWFRRSPSAHNYKKGNIKKTGNEQYLIWCTASVNEDNFQLRAFDFFNLQNVLNFHNSGSYIAFSKPKLEEGNVPTAWSPAPEDQQSQIDGINNNLSNNYYQKTTVDSKLSTAVSGITAQYTKDITTRLGNYYDKATIDSKLTIDGQGIASYVKNTQSQLNNLSIGSENLIINGGNITDISPWQPRYKDKFGIYKHPFYYNGEKNIFRLDTTSTTDENYVNSNRFEVKRNTDYTLSFIGFYNGNIRSAEVIFLGRKSTETNVQYSYVKSMPLVLSSGIAVYKTITFNSGDNDNGYIRIDNNGTLSEGNLSTLYFGEVMLVEGNVAKKYQPSSAEFPTLTQYSEVKQLADRISSTVYDSSTGLTTKVNQLANKYAITALNSAGDILASLNLNANTSTAEINAKLIRLNGSTKMDDAFVNNLVANSIITNKIKSTEISGDYIKGGTIQGVKIISNNGSGNVVLNNGRIDMDLTEQNVNRKSVGTFTPSYITMASYINGSNLDGSVSFDYTGFVSKIKDDSGKIQERRTQFGSEYLSIYPIKSSENSLNSGIRLYGKYAYLDLNGNKTTKVKGTVSRIVSNPDGNMQIINNDGNIYLNTKNGVQPMSNGYKIPYTFANDTEGIRYFRIVRPGASDAYIEIANNSRLWGVNMWLSDQRLKSNITSPTQDALDTVNQLQVRQFDWKSDNVHEDFGLVAQEVEQVLPNAVFKVGDYYQIKDSGLIPVLIGAVQKLSKKVNLLESIIYNTKGGNLL